MNPLHLITMALAATSTDDSIWRAKQAAFDRFNYRPGHGGKGLGRGPGYGKSEEAEKYRDQQRRKMVGRHKPFPTGGLTHHGQKRAALAAMLRSQANLERALAA